MREEWLSHSASLNEDDPRYQVKECWVGAAELAGKVPHVSFAFACTYSAWFLDLCMNELSLDA